MKRRLSRPPLLIDVKRLAAGDGARLRAIARDDGGAVRIGGLVTLAEVDASSEVRGGPYAALAEACASAASPQIRNLATIGGNLCQSPRCWYWRDGFPCLLHGGDRCHAAAGDARFHAIFAPPEDGDGAERCIEVQPSDPATALLALGAEVEIARSTGGSGAPSVRTVPLLEHLRAPTRASPRLHALAPGEAVTAVRLPAAPARRVSVHEKGMSREVWTFALASVAVAATLAADGTLVDVRVALGGVAATPRRAEAVERALEGQDPRAEAVRARAAQKAAQGSTPHAANAYKVPLLRGLVARALERLSGISAGS
jgi:xanthine dehydrogenase YagS FAD-binding subunit